MHPGHGMGKGKARRQNSFCIDRRSPVSPSQYTYPLSWMSYYYPENGFISGLPFHAKPSRLHYTPFMAET